MGPNVVRGAVASAWGLVLWERTARTGRSRVITSQPHSVRTHVIGWRPRALEWTPLWVSRAAALVGLLGIVGAALPMAARIDLVPALLVGVAPRATRAAAD